LIAPVVELAAHNAGSDEHSALDVHCFDVTDW
jgi:hypothetical protein